MLADAGERGERSQVHGGGDSHHSPSAIREALEKAQIQIVDKDDLKDAVLKKTAAAGVEEIAGGRRSKVEIYADNSNPISSAAAARVRVALDDFKGREGARVTSELRDSGERADAVRGEEDQYRGSAENVRG